MRVDEVGFIKPELSARLFAVELGITDFTRELRDEELAVLLCAGHLDAHGLKLSDVSGVLRWLGPHLPLLRLDIEGPPELITVLDYHDVVCSFVKTDAYSMGAGPISLAELRQRSFPAVSTAFSLRGILHHHRLAQARLRTTARIQKPSSHPA